MLSKIRKLRMNKYLLTLLAAANLFTLSSTHGMQLQVITEPTQNLFSTLDELTIKDALKTDNLKLFLKIVGKIDYPTFTKDMMFGKMVKFDQILRIIMLTKTATPDKIKNHVKEDLVTCISEYVNKHRDLKEHAAIISQLCNLNAQYIYLSYNQKYAIYTWYESNIPYLFRICYHLKNNNLTKMLMAIRLSFELSPDIKDSDIDNHLSPIQEKFWKEFGKIIYAIKKHENLIPAIKQTIKEFPTSQYPLIYWNRDGTL